METKQTKEELKEKYGTCNQSYPNFTKWKWEKLREWRREKERIEEDKNRTKNRIQELKKEMKELREKHFGVVEKPHIDETTYNYAKTDAKNKAEDEGWDWIEPMDKVNGKNHLYSKVGGLETHRR